jgi:cell division protein FtsW
MTRLPLAAIRPERGILVSTLLLCSFGLLMVFSSSAVLGIAIAHSPAHFLEAQLVKFLVGFVLLLGFWRLDYHVLGGRVAWIALAAIGAALLPLALPFGSAGSVDRWHRIGSFSIQPSEFARIILVVFLASYLSRKEGLLDARRLYRIPALVVLAMAGLIALQPNLSMALLVVLVAGCVLFLGGLPWRWLALATAGPGTLALIFMRDYQRERIASFLGLGGHEAGYQIEQSITAVGSGGVLGLGIGNGLQKYFYLPFPHTDFILGIVGEETGLLGITALLAAYAFLILMGIGAARRAPDTFGRLLAAGLTWNLALNLLVHAMVNMGLGPVTGVPLPLMSSGGSSLVANLFAIGILLSVARRSHGARIRDWSMVRGDAR